MNSNKVIYMGTGWRSDPWVSLMGGGTRDRPSNEHLCPVSWFSLERAYWEAKKNVWTLMFLCRCASTDLMRPNKYDQNHEKWSMSAGWIYSISRTSTEIETIQLNWWSTTHDLFYTLQNSTVKQKAGTEFSWIDWSQSTSSPAFCVVS